MGSEYIQVRLADGTDIWVEAVILGEQDVAFDSFAFDTVKDEIVRIAKAIADIIKGPLDSAKPSKVSVEFGIEVGVESGALTTILIKGTGKGNLSITLEWEND